MTRRENDAVKPENPLFHRHFVDDSINHCVKSVLVHPLFWSSFSRIRTECGPE